MKDPQTPHEWQEAVNLSEFLLLLDSARQYDLITGTGFPDINAVRCDELISRGAALGYHPLPDRQLIEIYLAAA